MTTEPVTSPLSQWKPPPARQGLSGDRRPLMPPARTTAPSVAEPPGAVPPAGRVRSRKRWPSLDDSRIRTKLGLILIVPVIAIVTLAALRLGDASGQARDAQLVGNLPRLSAQTSRLAHEVHREQMAAAVLLAVPKAAVATYTRQTKQTDAAITA